jgi:hypothetical protein
MRTEGYGWYRNFSFPLSFAKERGAGGEFAPRFEKITLGLSTKKIRGELTLFVSLSFAIEREKAVQGVVLGKLIIG